MEENITEKLRKEKRPNETLEWRVSNIEKHNQIRKIESTDGKTYFDTETGEFNISNADGSISLTAGKIVFKNAAGETIREQTGISETWWGKTALGALIKRAFRGWE